MKTKLTGLTLILLLCSTLNTLAQQFKWVKGGGTSDNLSAFASFRWEKTAYMCADSNGNTYALNIIGSTAVTADTFHASTGTSGGANNILITSYNCNGQMRWAKLISSGGYLFQGYGIRADNLGNIYITGRFDHSHSYPLHIGTDTTISTNDYNTTGIMQFDTSGHFHWVRFVGNNVSTTASNLEGSCMTLDTANVAHVYCLAGRGVVLRAGDTTRWGVYELMYSSSGSLLTTKRLGLDTTLLIRGAEIDKQTNNVYVYGNRSAAFSSLPYHTFVAELDTNRTQIWIDTLIDATGNAIFSGIATDNNGHIYFAGTGQGTISYLGDTITGGSVSFVIKADTAGNPQWMQRYIGTLNNEISCFALMPNNKMAIAGVILGRITVGGDTIISYAHETYNSFFSVLDTGGYVHALEQIHGDATYDYAWAIAADRVGNLYIGGEVGDSIWGGQYGWLPLGGWQQRFLRIEIRRGL